MSINCAAPASFKLDTSLEYTKDVLELRLPFGKKLYMQDIYAYCKF